MARSSRMLHYINYRMKVVLQDSRMLVGTFMAFDRHMNMVLGDCEEFRRIKSKKGQGQGISEEKEVKRTLGLVILRGDSVVSLTIEGPPPPEDDEKLVPGGPGSGRAAGRGLPTAPLSGAPVGLGGPIRGVGGPAGSMMQPPIQVAAQMSAQHQQMGMPPRGMPPPPGMMGGMPPRPPPGMMMPGMMGGGPPGMMMGGGPPGMMPPRGPPGMMPPRGPQ